MRRSLLLWLGLVFGTAVTFFLISDMTKTPSKTYL